MMKQRSEGGGEPGVREPAPVPAAGERQLNGFDRRRAATRLKLVRAAHLVMSRKGVEATTIAEITAEAGVGFGSFYNHFKTKEELARAVFAERTEHLGRMADKAVEIYPDFVNAVATIGLLYIEMASVDPVWGWFVIHADNALGLMDEVLGERARRHVRDGATSGALPVQDPDTVAMLTLTSFLALMRAMLEQRTTRAQAVRGVGLVLRMYGVEDGTASALRTLRLPAAIRRMLAEGE